MSKLFSFIARPIRQATVLRCAGWLLCGYCHT